MHAHTQADVRRPRWRAAGTGGEVEMGKRQSKGYQIRLRSRDECGTENRKSQGRDPVRTVIQEKRRMGGGGQGELETEVQHRVT